ncbi:MAG: ribonucleoside-diphosphate reductase, adenosylcobalamin-dependent, partial [Alphaproteobacteria bacterium]|nr:ribonucleoside-diphosphate reductase, adenosylcobalamin-dependent [Alphaproteobacteria bacterium]
DLATLVATSVRMLDNAIDVSKYPLPAQEHEAKAKRRLGLGITGLADALIMCGVRYDTDKGRDLAKSWVHALSRAAYLASTELAAEKGAFPLYDSTKYLATEGIQSLDEDVQAAIAKHGIRNALVTSVAPTGTISLFADNVSSGLEPVFSFSYQRAVLMPDGTRREEEVTDYAYRLFRQLKGEDAPLPSSFMDSQGMLPADHVRMQAAIQSHIDSAVSKTINVPVDTPFDEFKTLYVQAYDAGCKGCTTFRPNDVTGSVLALAKSDKAAGEPELPFETPVPKQADQLDAGAVVYMTKPLDRPGVLPGSTYKVHWPESDHAIYITINDIIQDSRRRPFEIFLNSKNMEHYAWTMALTRMISAVFRRGGDVSFVVEELKAVFDPRGGQWVDGRYVPSLLAAIGGVIEEHLVNIGFSEPTEAAEAAEAEALKVVGGGGEHVHANSQFSRCPKCSLPSLVHQEGCDTCTSCGYSKCS